MSSERGSITVVTAAVIAMVVVITMGTADIGKVLVARSRARVAADAAALAAAQELVLPSGLTPGEVAGDYAARNGATLIMCTCAAATTDGVLTFSVSDDGKGFDTDATSYGTGLQGIADRLAALGGEITIRSTPNAGTTVTGTVPAGVTL